VSDQILRFRQSERQLHWALAVPFLISYSTAVILVVFYNPHPERPLREVVSWMHKISGVSLFLLPTLTVLRHRREFRVYLRNIREGWGWRLDDIKWLLLMGPAAFNKKIALPHQGKFNAAEKINFMVLMCTYPLYILTGVLIWLPGVALLAWLLHFSLAVAATPLVFGHMFMAVINPDTRVGLSGMISGFVDRQWARHHYRRWYDENFETPAARPAPAPRPAVPAVAVAPAAAAAPVAASAEAREGVPAAAPRYVTARVSPAVRAAADTM
jgi:formate dehydrogenase subunit gamma